MKRLNGTEMKTLFILSIVVPVSLLTTLRLTGILPEPTIETITLEAIKWEFERPNQSVILDETLKSQYSSGEILAIMTVRIGEYTNDDPIFGDLVSFAASTNLTTTVPNSFVEGVYIFLQTDNQSPVRWLHTDFRFENLSLIDVEEWGWRDTRAYVNLESVNRPKGAYFSGLPLYSLTTPNNQTHQLEASFELTYYSGTAYKKVVQRFQLKFVGR